MAVQSTVCHIHCYICKKIKKVLYSTVSPRTEVLLAPPTPPKMMLLRAML